MELWFIVSAVDELLELCSQRKTRRATSQAGPESKNRLGLGPADTDELGKLLIEELYHLQQIQTSLRQQGDLPNQMRTLEKVLRIQSLLGREDYQTAVGYLQLGSFYLQINKELYAASHLRKLLWLSLPGISSLQRTALNQMYVATRKIQLKGHLEMAILYAKEVLNHCHLLFDGQTAFRSFNTSQLREEIQAAESLYARLKVFQIEDPLAAQDLARSRLLETQYSDDQLACSICLNSLLNRHPASTTIYELQCEHVFHSHCLHLWLAKQNRCPNCRKQILY